MTKYYRLLKDTPIWIEGAIISDDNTSDGYQAIEDIWDRAEKAKDHWESKAVIEAPENKDFFERVYKDKMDKAIFHTKEELKKVYERFKK